MNCRGTVQPRAFSGALTNLGYTLSDETVGNILRRNGIVPAPERKQITTWKDFIRAHLDVLAGTDFFSVEVLTLRGLVTFYVLFFIHLESRKIEIAGITPHPNEPWMKQIARNVTLDEWRFLAGCRYLLHDRDSKFTQSFRLIIESGGVTLVRLPARSPNLNAHAERWVKSVKDAGLSKLIFFGEASAAFVTLVLAVSPFTAAAAYFVARRLEHGQNPSLRDSLGKVRARALSIGLFSLVCAMTVAAWFG